MRRYLAIIVVTGLVVLAGCSPSEELTVEPAGAGAGEPEAETIVSASPVTTPDDDQVGESKLERETDGIALKLEACCVKPGNAYTAWWVIGDVIKPMSAVKTQLAAGWVAESEEVNLELELEAGPGGIRNALDGVRIAVLDHGPETGDNSI